MNTPNFRTLHGVNIKSINYDDEHDIKLCTSNGDYNLTFDSECCEQS